MEPDDQTQIQRKEIRWGFAAAACALLICGFLAASRLSYTAGLACWFAGGIAGSMGISKRCFPITSGIAMCLNGFLFIWGFLALRFGVPH